MIRALRRKFILVAMLSTFVVLAAIMGTVNVVNYWRLCSRADGMTSLLAQNDGKFPGDLQNMEPSNNTENIPDSIPENPVFSKKRPKGVPGTLKQDDFSPETPYETRFFTVTLDNEQNMISLNTDSIAAVDEEAAQEYAVKAASDENTTGFQGIYRYRIVEEEDCIRCIFLDCRTELTGFRNLTFICVSVSALGLAAVFILVFLFSRLVFRPVEESLEKQKRFITDASHELKTPLTIIDANTEVMEMENGESQWTKSTRKQIQRLAALTQQLVTLARLDEEQGAGDKMEFSLSDALEESIRPFEAPAQTQEKKLTYHIEEGISYFGNEKSIRQMIGILLDNAVKYSSQGGIIRITLTKKGKKIYLEVFNEADELPKGKLDILFERFYRLDTSRNSDTGGSGIGLSVAKAIVQAHKGKINAYSEDGKSLTITAVL
ncbi:MAG: HAMP domain-containing sensor histidine kinase [Eubacteriales bacterium]|nr:HAMP domain-containing sensor histidine kinase [Eubacteriales bacterium]